MTQLELFTKEVASNATKVKRERKLCSQNLDLTRGLKFTQGGIPILIPYYCSEVPRYWQLFTQAMSAKTRNRNAGVMFYQDDYKFERVWANPMKYCSILAGFPCVASTDFSLYVDMPLELQRWNVYRNRLLAACWQLHGVKMIPSVSWSTKESYDFCFDGIVGGTVFISTVGVLNNSYSKQLWIDGAVEMVNRINPQCIIIYGHKIDFDFYDINVTYIDYISKKGGANYGW